MDITKSKYYIEGYDAYFKDGYCPYNHDTDAYCLWWRGYDEAESEDFIQEALSMIE